MAGLEDHKDDEIDTDDLEEELAGFKTAEQLRFEILIQRLSYVSLLCSAFLFIGHIISASIQYHLDLSSTITGFCLSLFLFLVWFSIHRIYSQSDSNVRESILAPLNLRLRFRSNDEIKLMIPKQWLVPIATVYFVSSLVMSSCEIYLMTSGIVSHYSDLGPIHGVRIGVSVIFVSTGITCFCMIQRTQKPSTGLATLVLSLASIISC